MVKLKRDRTHIYSDRYYIWTYHNQWTYKGKKKKSEAMYEKKICGIPFYSRYHARHVAVTLLGVDALSYIHIIYGKKLRKLGVTDIPKVLHNQVVFKGFYRPLRQFVYPPEARMDSHRRRHFCAKLYNRYQRRGRKAFDKLYKKLTYGFRIGFSKYYYRKQGRKVNNLILQELQKTYAPGSRDI